MLFDVQPCNIHVNMYVMFSHAISMSICMWLHHFKDAHRLYVILYVLLCVCVCVYFVFWRYRKEFETLKRLGKGGFGDVFLVIACSLLPAARFFLAEETSTQQIPPSSWTMLLWLWRVTLMVCVALMVPPPPPPSFWFRLEINSTTSATPSKSYRSSPSTPAPNAKSPP